MTDALHLDALWGPQSPAPFALLYVLADGLLYIQPKGEIAIMNDDLMRNAIARADRRLLLQKLAGIALEAAIFITTVVSMWLVTAPGPMMKWGYLIALAAQPLWLLATWRARRWGMFASALLVYTPLWARGVVNFFF